MKPFTIQTADGGKKTFRTFDPLVADYCTKTSSCLDALLHQINNEKIYRDLFTGENMTFLDLGANIGLVSLYASPVCNKIVAVEPDPKTFLVLKSMTMKFPNIEPLNVALAPTNGVTTFYMNDINATASSTVNTYGTPTIVNGLTLMSILHHAQLEHVDVCKVDVEGAEGESLLYEELQAASKVVDSWYIETHNCPKTTWEHKLGSLTWRLVRCGYSRINITGMTLAAFRK